MQYRIINDFFLGKFRKSTLLLVLAPLLFVSYFAVLVVAVWLFPSKYEWYHKSISKLLYPANNPTFYAIPSSGLTISGFLIFPFAAYISRGLRAEWRLCAEVGFGAFATGAISLVLASVVVWPLPFGSVILLRLHETFARICALALGVGMLAFYACAVRANLSPRRRRLLVASWSIVTVPGIVAVALRLLVAAKLECLNRLCIWLKNPQLWQLGFWEWAGSVGVFIFLLSGIILLPESPESRRPLKDRCVVESDHRERQTC